MRLVLMPVAHWLALFESVGVPSAKINGIDEAFELAQQLGLAATYSQLESGTDAVRQVANPISLSKTPAGYWRSPPDLGEDDDDVRSWLTTDWNRPDSVTSESRLYTKSFMPHRFDP
jgi:crotonobetainyl-CoA:carnitine CoA-transferase CaiB-like acyl-CoA transferase